MAEISLLEKQLKVLLEGDRRIAVAEAQSLDLARTGCKLALAHRPRSWKLEEALRQLDCEQCTDAEE